MLLTRGRCRHRPAAGLESNTAAAALSARYGPPIARAQAPPARFNCKLRLCQLSSSVYRVCLSVSRQVSVSHAQRACAARRRLCSQAPPKVALGPRQHRLHARAQLRLLCCVGVQREAGVSNASMSPACQRCGMLPGGQRACEHKRAAQACTPRAPSPAARPGSAARRARPPPRASAAPDCLSWPASAGPALGHSGRAGVWR